MSLRFDYSQFQAWERKLRNQERGLNAFLLNFLRQESEWFIQRAAMRTPIDLGRLVRSWQIKSVTRKGNEVTAVIVNTANDGYADYSSFVEYGHATPGHSTRPYRRSGEEEMVYPAPYFPGGDNWVRGYFMATYSLKEVIDRMPDKLQRQLKAYLR